MLPNLLNGTLREHYLLLFGMAAGIAGFVGFVAAWAGAQFGARRAARGAAREALQEGGLGVDRNLAALIQAVDSMALEVERLSEGQRFTARLLSERAATPITVARNEGTSRPITPH